MKGCRFEYWQRPQSGTHFVDMNLKMARLMLTIAGHL